MPTHRIFLQGYVDCGFADEDNFTPPQTYGEILDYLYALPLSMDFLKGLELSCHPLTDAEQADVKYTLTELMRHARERGPDGGPHSSRQTNERKRA